MKRFSFLILTFLCFSNISYSQINQYGQAFIRNYSIKEYNAGSQNWAVAKDQRGIMYFANNDGVLEYDGRNWDLIKINKGAIVRSLAIDSSGIIYVGAEKEFGYIQANQYGKLYYTSLSDSLDAKDEDFANIEKVHITNNGVMFCAFKKIFIFSNGKIQTISLPKGGFYSLHVNNDFYMGEYWKGLMKLEEDSFINCKGGEFYAGMDIFDIIPYNNSVLIIATSNNGLFLYNSKNGKSKNPKYSEYDIIHDFLSEYPLYGASKHQSSYIINTLYGGTVITDSIFTIKELYNKTFGLQDDVVLGSFENNDNSTSSVLWLTLNNGISKVENNSAFRFFNENSGLHDEVLDIIQFENKFYFATINGVYKLEEKDGFPFFKYIDETEGECWSLLEYDNTLLVGGGYNIYILKENKTLSFETESMVFKLYASVVYPGRIYVGKEKGISLYNLKDGEFIEQSILKNINNKIYDIIEDDDGTLWLTTGNNELIKVNLSVSDTIITVYNDSLGFPQTESLHAFKYENEIYFSTQHALLKYNKESDMLNPIEEMDSTLKKETVFALQQIQDINGNIWLISNKDGSNRVKLLEKQKDSRFKMIETPFKRIPKCMINKVYPDKNGIVWIGTSEGLYTFNSNLEFSYDDHYNILIRKVFIGEDSVLYHGNNQGVDFIPDPLIDYKNNALTFHYSSAFYIEESETKFSFFLEGFDQESSGWSNWTKETKKEYSYLREGLYRFKVKAKNIYGLESKLAEYSFEILPPWYRTILAYIVYFILSVIFIWVIVKLNVRRLQFEKTRLEGIVKERTTEIRQQKEEIEIQKEEITDSIIYAKRIQAAILPPDELISEQLPKHFVLFKPRDIVSGDFYWMKQIGDYTLIAAADCTGHGVPGAFMSMLGIAFLNEIVRQEDVLSAGDVLTELRNHVKHSLRQTGKEGEAKDGMDIAFCVINKKEMKLQFAGAYNPLYLFRNVNQANLKEFEGLKIIEDEKYNLNEIKADKMPIGIHLVEKDNFTNHEIDLKTGDTFYMFSDGYVDQIGGERNKKFMSKPFKKLLFEIQDKEMLQQKNILDDTIENWKGDEEQMDDILLIGIRI